MPYKTFGVLFVLSLLSGCADSQKTATLEDLYTREVRMANGDKYRVEVATKKFDMSKGMMFRESLAPDRGMLFVHGEPGLYPYWTYQVKVPLDMIWLDQNRLVTEIVPAAQPCPSDSALKCPKYGGNRRSLYVLELNAGVAAKHNLKPGDRIDF